VRSCSDYDYIEGYAQQARCSTGWCLLLEERPKSRLGWCGVMVERCRTQQNNPYEGLQMLSYSDIRA